jgi:hypothetical protein
MSRLSLSSHIRLGDGSVMSVREALDKRLVRKSPRFHIQNDETAGNIVGLATRWKTQRSFFTDLENARQSLASYGKGARLIEFTAITAPDGSADWGDVSQRVLPT